MWDQFDINVMVNGSRCKQYTHEGRKYVEAKDGSEWYFQIQNNSPGRVLAVCSVDGLNVLTGETATKKDSGYVIDSYHSQKIKGFRFSDEEWAMFKFGYKIDKSTGAPNGKVYAVSKGKETAKNCGVIGVRLFYEKFKKVEYVAPPQYSQYNYTTTGSYSLGASYAVSSSWSSNSISGCASTNASWTPKGATGGLYGEGRFGYTPNDNRFNLANMTEDYYIPVAGAAGPISPDQYPTDRNSLRDRFNRVRSTYYNAYTRDLTEDKKPWMACAGLKQEKPKGFDIGTEFGKREKSKVEVVDFERGCQAYYVDIFYASRESLIEMGVPINNTLKVNYLPQSFPNKYCTPPKNWNG